MKLEHLNILYVKTLLLFELIQTITHSQSRDRLTGTMLGWTSLLTATICVHKGHLDELYDSSGLVSPFGITS